MASAILRQWLILSMLPKPPRRVDTATIEARLRERGARVHRRTIQRDLVQLSAIFPIVADDRHKPFGWRWADDGAPAPLFVHPDPGPPRPDAGAAGAGGAGGAGRLVVRLRVREGALADVMTAIGGRDVAHHRASSTVTCSVPDAPMTCRLLFGLVESVEVVGPPALRRELAALAERAQRLYGDPSRRSR